MKKTTWAIIGLSVCVVVLASALGVVLLQKKTETIILSEPDTYTISFRPFKNPWQNFYIDPFKYKDFYNSRIKVYLGSEHSQKGIYTYHNGRIYDTTRVIFVKGTSKNRK